MDDAAQDNQALFEAVVFLNHFNDMPDPRQRGKVTYPLDEVRLLALRAVLAGAESFVEIARFGEKKLDLLRRFRPFRDGTPAHDHLGDIFANALGVIAISYGFLGGADGIRATGLKHAIKNRDADGVFGLLTCKGPCPKLRANNPFVSAHRGFHERAAALAGRLLPSQSP